MGTRPPHSAITTALTDVESRTTAANARPDDNLEVEVPEGLEDVAPAYLEARRRDVEAAVVLLARGDFDGLAAMGHNMKGTGCSYGFQPLTDLGASLEEAARAGDTSRTEQHLQILQAYLSRVRLSAVR